MTRILSSKFKFSRTLGTSIWGSAKDSFHKRNYKPGPAGASATQVKLSDYGLHLRAKQRLRVHYGVIREKQFRGIAFKAQKMKGNTAENLVFLLESRLDALVYRMKLAPTIFAARQLVSHGHISVNGKKLNIPSAKINLSKDVITMVDKSKQLPIVLASVVNPERKVPDYIEFDPNSLTGKLIRKPLISDVPYPFEPDLNLIVEFYSR